MLGKETVFSPRPIECIRFAAAMLSHETRRFEERARMEASRMTQLQPVVR